jgi:hypothetical protein
MPRDEETQRLLTMGRAAGVNLAGQEYEQFLEAMQTPYPSVGHEESEGGASKLYPAGTLEDLQMEMLRRCNITMPCKTNQLVYGTIYAVSKNRRWVDVGHSTLAMFNRKVRRAVHIELAAQVQAACAPGSAVVAPCLRAVRLQPTFPNDCAHAAVYYRV